MKAIAKVRPEPGVAIVDVPEPALTPGSVRIQLEAASVCGTDLHIYNWDPWSASRIVPPRIIGHEFCGTVIEVASDVQDRKVGDFVSSESHITCGTCLQCQHGQRHVCVRTRILGVDVDGGFASQVVIPAENARPTDRRVPKFIACFQDALGNAVHTAMAGPLENRTVLITGMGPIGMFAVSICKALGARKVVGTEVSAYRAELARQVGVDAVFDPTSPDIERMLAFEAPEGFDATLEMSGHPSQLALAVRQTRPGGRISLLGVYHENHQSVDLNAVVFKGLEVQGIVGRNLWKTWEQMGDLLATGKLILEPVITHQMHYTEFAHAMELMNQGKAGKVVFSFDS